MSDIDSSSSDLDSSLADGMQDLEMISWDEYMLRLNPRILCEAEDYEYPGWCPIYNRLFAIIEEERERSPTFATNFEGWKISHLKCGDKIFRGCEFLRGCDNDHWPFYSIGQYWEDFRHKAFILEPPPGREMRTSLDEPRTITVRSGPIDNRLELEIRFGWDKYWKPVRQWLRGRWGGYEYERYRLELMWMQSGERFRLMELPREIRDKIFGYIVGPRIWPRLICRCCNPRRRAYHVSYSDYVRSLEGRTGPNWLYPECFHGIHPVSIEAPTAKDSDARALEFGPLPEDTHADIGPSSRTAELIVNLFCTSKQVREEVEELVWGSTTVKRFNRRFDLAQMLEYLRLHTLRRKQAGFPLQSPIRDIKCLRHVSLSFTNAEYFRFIGYESEPGVGFKPNETFPSIRLELLTDIPTLQHLDLQFQVLRPDFPDAHPSDPRLNYDPWCNVNPRAEKQVSCQRKWVKIFLTLAYTRLRSVAKVTLSGHVKDSTRAKWEPRLRGGGEYDVTAALEKVLSTPASKLPPACRCQPPCAWWKVPYATNTEASRTLQEFSPKG